MRADVGQRHTVRSNAVGECYLRKPDQNPNVYDACLAVDCGIWNQLVGQGGLHKLCCPQGRQKYAHRPWVAMPAEGRRFKPIGILAVADYPLPFDFSDAEVLRMRVPLGYDGVITDVVCELSAPGGTGFVEAAGDIAWRLSANGTAGNVRRFLRDLGNLQVTIGSLTVPSPVPRGGIRIYSDDLVIFTAAFAVGAEVRINPLARVICSVTGWFYPR